MILVSMNILTDTLKHLLSVHRNIVLLKTGVGGTSIGSPGTTERSFKVLSRLQPYFVLSYIVCIIQTSYVESRSQEFNLNCDGI